MSLYYSNDGNRVSRFFFESVYVTGEFIENLGEVKVTQTWINETDDDVSAIYMFSLKEDYILNKFCVRIGELDFAGVVSVPNERNNESAELYQMDSSSQKLSLLQKFNKLDYCIQLGIIEPHCEVVIEFSFLIRAEINIDGSYQFVLPNVAPPRVEHNTVKYIENMDDLDSDIEGECSNDPRYDFTVRVLTYNFNVEIVWQSGCGFREISSQENNITTTFLDEHHVSIQCCNPTESGDFSVCVKTN